jgi:hypothetical protein
MGTVIVVYCAVCSSMGCSCSKHEQHQHVTTYPPCCLGSCIHTYMHACKLHKQYQLTLLMSACWFICLPRSSSHSKAGHHYPWAECCVSIRQDPSARSPHCRIPGQLFVPSLHFHCFDATQGFFFNINQLQVVYTTATYTTRLN